MQVRYQLRHSPEYPGRIPEVRTRSEIGFGHGDRARMLFGRESALRRVPFAALDVARSHVEPARASITGFRGRFRVHSWQLTHGTGMHGREVRDRRQMAHGSSESAGPVVAGVVLELDVAEVLQQRGQVHAEPAAVALALAVPAADRVVG